jgi:hypothetical protein
VASTNPIRLYQSPSLTIAAHMRNAGERLANAPEQLAHTAPRRGARAATQAPEDALLGQMDDLRQAVARLSDLLYRTDRVEEATLLARRLDQLASEVTAAGPSPALLKLTLGDLQRVAVETIASPGAPPARSGRAKTALHRGKAKTPGFFDLTVTKGNSRKINLS